MEEYKRRGICYDKSHARPVVKENGVCPICSPAPTPVAPDRAEARDGDVDGDTRRPAEHDG